MKYPKSEVGFQLHPDSEGHRCSQCVHFEVLAPKHCERVEGKILANNYCERFFKMKSRMAAAMKKEA